MLKLKLNWLNDIRVLGRHIKGIFIKRHEFLIFIFPIKQKFILFPQFIITFQQTFQIVRVFLSLSIEMNDFLSALEFSLRFMLLIFFNGRKQLLITSSKFFLFDFRIYLSFQQLKFICSFLCVQYLSLYLSEHFLNIKIIDIQINI